LTADGTDDTVAAVKASLALLLLLAAAPSSALAASAGERVAVAVFAVSGQSLAPEAQAKLRSSLRGGLAAAGFDVVPNADVDQAVNANGLAGCDTLSCMRRIGELVLARRVIKATIEVIGNTHVVSQLELIDLGDGKVVASAKDNCDVCTMKEVNDGLSNAAAALRMQVEPPAPPAAPPAPPPPETKLRRSTWLILTGVGAAVLAAGAVSLGVSAAYDGHGNCDSSLPAFEHCPTSYRGAPGIALGAIGLGLGAAATGVFAWRAAKAAPAKKVSLVPALGLGAAAVAVTW
jgi:hypothetical protein